MNNQPPLDTRYPDLLEGQDDPALARLVYRLDALYTANQPPARLTHSPAAPDRQFSSLTAPIPPVGTFAADSRSPRRWSRLSTLAAVVFTLLLVGALSGTFYLLRRDVHPGRATPTPGIASTSVSSPTQSATPQSVVRGPHACPEQATSMNYWESVLAPYAHRGAYHIERISITCANLQGPPAVQALASIQWADAAHTLDVFVFTGLLNTHPQKLFQLLGLVQGDARISAYSTLMTAQADQLSTANAGKAVSAMTADLFREFKWSANARALVQTAFPGIFPDMTRYQAEADQEQISQGHQSWKLSATQVATTLAVSLLQWSPNSTATLLSGGGANDTSAVVRVRNSGLAAGIITVTLSRLEGDIDSGNIWEAISVTSQGFSLTSPAPLAQITNPAQVTGTGQAFEGVIGKLIVLDHLYTSLGQASATGVSGMGQTTFSTTVSYQTTFPAGSQEGVLFLSIPSNADGSIAAAILEKVLIK